MLLALMIGWALAQDEATPPVVAEPVAEQAAPPAPAEIASEEIVVWGERLERARSQLDVDLRHYGYTLRKVEDGWSVYGRKGRDRWKPRVRVNRDGLLVFDDPRLVFMVPWATGTPPQPVRTGPAGETFDNPDAPATQLALPIQVPSRRLQDQEKHRVLEVVGSDLAAFQEARLAIGEAQLLSELPAKLDALWQTGKDPGSDQIFASPAERRAALVALWASRADTPAGQATRQLIETFLAEEVQRSNTPMTEAERAAAVEKGLRVF